MIPPPHHIGVVGAGAWGTALAHILSRSGPVTLWARSQEVAAAINRDHANPLYLPGLAIAPDVRATTDPDDLDAADALLVVTPAQHMRTALAPFASWDRSIILCSKGIEAGTRLLMSEVALDVCPKAKIAVLSGPTFAHEVAAGLPTAVTLACADDLRHAGDGELPPVGPARGPSIAIRLAQPGFRPYSSTDVIGAEIGGAVKNVLAIACGVVEGRGLGQNARAAVISRGFAEMSRFGLARGARAETLAGLSGLGDLVLTCSSTASRNYSLGIGLGRGERAADLLASRRTVAEGAATAPVLVEAARDAGVEMPIAEAVRDLLAGDAEVGAVVERLLARPLVGE